MGVDLNSPFVASDKVRSIVAAFVAKGWSYGATTTAGTLTQTVLIKPVQEYGGSMLCEMKIIGEDTDADDNEAVTFAEEFVDIPAVFPVDANATGFQLTVASDRATTGFTYQNEGAINNLAVAWVAEGAVLVAV